MTPHKNAEVLIALAEGKKVEWAAGGAWHEYTTLDKVNPAIESSVLWRVSTEPPIPVDTPVWVRDSPDGNWLPRHASTSPGYAWAEGGTSHTTAETVRWNYITTERPASLNPETSEES